jgi:molecular chaperone GrpE (heat shock protein)
LDRDLTLTIQSASNNLEGAYSRCIEQLKLEHAAVQEVKMQIQAVIDKWKRKLEEQTAKTHTLEGMLRGLESQRQELHRCFEK